MAPTQTFHEHVAELRKRLLWVFLAIATSAIAGYNLRNTLVQVLQRPLREPLFYSSPAGSFNFIMQISAIVGIFIALPIMVYQLLRFIEPALPKRIKNASMVTIIGASFLLATGGAAFAFFDIIPESLHFFAGYSSNGVLQPLISANEYLRFVTNTVVTFAVIFQIPLIFYFIDKIKPLKPSKLLKYQKHVIVAAFAIAVVLPFTYDPITQFIIAIPIVVLFYVSVTLLAMTNWRRNKKLKKLAAKVRPEFKIAQPKMPQRQLRPTTYIGSLQAVSMPAKPRPVLAMDGFVRRPNQPMLKKAVDISMPQPQTKVFKTSGFTPVKPAPQTAKKGLSLDGVSRPLGLSSAQGI